MRAAFPLPDTDWEPTRELWAGAAAGELRIPRCDACSAHQWYPAPRCARCGGPAFTWVAVSGRGTLFSWVEVRHPFIPQFAEMVPFLTGLVALEEDPAVRLATRVVDADPSELSFDLPMEVTFRTLRFAGVEGSATAPLFRPAPLRPALFRPALFHAALP